MKEKKYIKVPEEKNRGRKLTSKDVDDYTKNFYHKNKKFFFYLKKLNKLKLINILCPLSLIQKIWKNKSSGKNQV